MIRPITALALLTLSAVPATAAAPKVGDMANDFTLKTPAGVPIRLASLREKGPVVLVVLRGWPGYQCPLCTKQVAQFLSKAAELDAAGAQVLLVYPGPADGLTAHAEEFANAAPLPDNVHFVIDPDYSFTKLYDLRWDAPKETAYPSTLVIDPRGKITSAKVSHSHGDRAPIADVLAALARSTR